MLQLDPSQAVPAIGRVVYLRKGEELERSGIFQIRLLCIGGLLGLVSPPLRSVMVSLCDKQIVVFCFYEGQITMVQRSDMALVGERVKEDAPDDHSVVVKVDRVDSPKKAPWIGELVYARREWQ